ncbi:MAG: hypothetical protein GX591_17215 [Planctomycetes bacterium]|nr:hypothetical protein [Planctomycetota bacterium]
MMRPTAFRWMMILTLAWTATAALGGAAFEPLDAARRAAIVGAAPQPVRLDTTAQVRLVDTIDCANPNDPHPMADDGTSRITDSPLGAYRETAINDNSFFAYRFFVDNPRRPHLVVAEYPDDDERIATIFFHEEPMKGLYNSDFHVEGGYYTGAELPVTGGAGLFQAYVWPITESPAIVCHNQRPGKRAALRRIWVYEILGDLPAAGVNEPAGEPTRRIGSFFEDTRMLRFNFGGYGPAGAERLMAFLSHTGQNLFAFDAVLYNYPKCSLPQFGQGNNDTESILAAADKHGIEVIAVFDPTAGFKVNGIETGDLTDAAVRQGWMEALEAFVDTYGSHRSLKGISFGGPAGCNRMIYPGLGAFQQQIHAMVQRKRPDLTVHVYFGYHFLHRFMFLGEAFRPDTIVTAWEEQPDRTFRQALADKVAAYYNSIHLDMDDYRDRPGMRVHRSFYPNDHRCFRYYPLRTPRYPIFLDFNEASEVAALTAGAQGACLFGNYFEVTTGLFGGEAGNFWWDRTWIAPQINPAEPFFNAPYANALAQSDVVQILNASWVEPTVGGPQKVLQFARAYRTLPARPFETVASKDFVVVRQLRGAKGTYVYVLNNHYTAAEVALTLDGAAVATDLVEGTTVADATKVAVGPYELRTFRLDAPRAVTGVQVARRPAAYDKLRQDVRRLGELIARAKNEGPEEISAAYVNTHARARELLDAGEVQQAADVLGAMPAHELQLRIDLAGKRPAVTAAAPPAAFALDGDLREWTAGPSLRIETRENIIVDRWVFNRWEGPEDLSATVAVARDGARIIIAFRVCDEVSRPGDAISFEFDADEYDHRGDGGRFDRVVAVAAPEQGERRGADQVVVRTADGYAGELVIDLADLNLQPGRPLGFHVNLADMDMDPEEFARLIKGRRDWRRETRLEWPAGNDNYIGTRDPRSCGWLVVE